MVEQIRDVEFLQAGSEVEALLLENNLIKKWKPKFNIRLRDDKTYPYLKLDMSHKFPRPYIARKQLKGDKNLYFGPFPNGGALRKTFHFAAKLFQIRDCRDHEFANRSRPCLSHQIGQCTAPCVDLVTEAAYRKQVDDFAAFVNGETDVLEEMWQSEMNEASEQMDFERAARLRDRIQAMKDVSQEQRTIETVELADRDVWALYPDTLEETEDFLLDIVILQFRAGKWVGRVHRTADLSEQLETEDFLANFLLQHYARHTVPHQILLPATAHLPNPEEFAVALAAAVKAPEPPTFHRVSDRADWTHLWELAHNNVKNLHDEGHALRERFEDGLSGIARMLDLPNPPRHMECIDISNMQGEANVASCVVFRDGRPQKDQYRHYIIKGVEGQNDFASMKEVCSRRFGKPDSPSPDLLVIDGGRGQLASVMEILKTLNCTFPAVGLAKARTEKNFSSEEVKASEERIFVPNQKNFIKIRNMQALRILTHIRDEAHRFAIEFHRLKRAQARGLD